MNIVNTRNRYRKPRRLLGVPVPRAKRGSPWVDCFDCKGTGERSPFGETWECARCKGSGRIENTPVN